MNFGPWIGLIALVISLYILWQVRQILLLLFTAVVLATALNILVERFQKSRIKRTHAILLSLVIVNGVIVAFTSIVVPPFVEQIQSLEDLVPLGMEKLSSWITLVEARLSPRLIEAIPDLEQLTRQLAPLLRELVGGGFAIFSTSLEVLLSILLVLVLTLMLLGNPHPYRRGFMRLFPSFYRQRVDKILERCEASLQGWLIGTLLNMGVISILSFVGLVALEIPLALSQALVAGILTFIPNVGPTLSVIPPVAIALLDEPWKAPTVLVLYIIIQQVESNLLTPLVMQQQVSLLPAITLVAQIFFARLFGFLGIFLALPLTVVGQVWIDEVLIKDVLDRWQGEAASASHCVPVTRQTETIIITTESPGAVESE